MQDLETKSLWSQISGECISGVLEGKKLEELPAVHTTFGEFKKTYPGGMLLRKEARGEHGSPYKDYFSDKSKLGIFGRLNSYKRLDGKDKVFGVRLGSKEVAISEAYLADNGYAVIEDGDRSVVVTFDVGSGTVGAFSLKGQVDPAVEVVIDESEFSLYGQDARWDSRTGKSMGGGESDLEPVPVVTSYWFAWIGFFPETDLIK